MGRNKVHPTECWDLDRLGGRAARYGWDRLQHTVCNRPADRKRRRAQPEGMVPAAQPPLRLVPRRVARTPEAELVHCNMEEVLLVPELQRLAEAQRPGAQVRRIGVVPLLEEGMRDRWRLR